MKTQVTRRIVGVLIVSGCVLVVAFAAFAGVPAAPTQSVEGVEHHWVTRQMRYAPYTEQNTAEKAAVAAATLALTEPPQSLISQADKGYTEAQRLIDLAASLKGTDPVIAGHEVLVWNEDEAADLFVSVDGVVKLLSVGTPQQLLVSRATSATDAGDRDAIEIATAAFDVAHGLDVVVIPATGGLLAAHAVGFAREDGSHVIVRVDTAGTASFPEW